MLISGYVSNEGISHDIGCSILGDGTHEVNVTTVERFILASDAESHPNEELNGHLNPEGRMRGSFLPFNFPVALQQCSSWWLHSKTINGPLLGGMSPKLPPHHYGMQSHTRSFGAC